MSKRFDLSDYPGPTAPWLDDQDEVQLNHAIREAARFLRENLERDVEQRVERLKRVDVRMDDVVQEAQAQLAECARSGRLAEAEVVLEMVFGLLGARTNGRGL